MELVDVLEDTVGDEEVNKIRHADSVAVSADKPQQVDACCAVTLHSEQVVQCALSKGVAREVGRVIGDDRRANDVRVVDVMQWSRDRLSRDDVCLKAVVQRQRSFQIEVWRHATFQSQTNDHQQQQQE